MSELKWTDEKPTAPGPYFYRENAQTRPVAFEVYEWAARLMMRWPDGSESEVDREDGQFAGPIPEPTE